MNSYVRLFKNTGLIFLGQLGSKLLTYLLLPLYTSILTTSEYGTYSFITTTISLLMPILTIDIFEACFRFVLDQDKDKRQVFSIGVYVTGFSGIILLFAYPLSIFIPILNTNYIFFIFLLLSGAFRTFLMQFIKGCEKIKLYSMIGTINTGIVLTLNIFFLLVLDMRLKGYFLAYIISDIIIIILILYNIKFNQYILPIKKVSRQYFIEMTTYSIPMVPNSICWWISNSSDIYMMEFMIGTAAMGIYSISYKIPSALSVIASIFFSAWSISAVEKFGSESSKRMYSEVYNTLFVFLGISVSVLISLAEFLGEVFYKKEFFMAWESSAILLVAFWFNSISAYLGSVYISAKQTNMLFISTLIASLINIILNFLLIPKFGMYGAAGATCTSYFLVWFIRIINTKYILDFQKNTKHHILTIIIIVIQLSLVYNDDIINKFSACAVALTLITVVNHKLIINIIRKIYNKFSKL